MRRGFLIIGLGVIVALAAYAGSYFAGTARSRQLLHSQQPELAWLKQEYHLSDAQFARVLKLHNAYLPQCEKRCNQIAALNVQLEQALLNTSSVTPIIQGLLNRRAQLRVKCQTEMLKHFYAVSRTMPPAEGRRYLLWVQQHTCLKDSMTMRHNLPQGMKPN